jgi:hypothetical protein
MEIRGRPLDFDHPGFVHTVLVDMRERLRRSERPNRIFEAVLAVAKEAGLVGRKRVLDSTALYDAVATQDTVTMIRAAIRGLLRVVDATLVQEIRTALAARRRGDTMTLAVEQEADVRRLHYAEHWPVGTIASQLGIHPDAVKRVPGLFEPRAPAPPRPRLVDTFRPFIDETLHRFPRLRATRLHDSSSRAASRAACALCASLSTRARGRTPPCIHAHTPSSNRRISPDPVSKPGYARAAQMVATGQVSENILSKTLPHVRRGNGTAP